jgi:hypothetical protein
MGYVACPPISPDPLRLAGIAVKADTNMKGVKPLGINTCRWGGALPVMGTTLAMAKGTASVRSADRADKATTIAPKALGPRAYGRAGGAGQSG